MPPCSAAPAVRFSCTLFLPKGLRCAFHGPTTLTNLCPQRFLSPTTTALRRGACFAKRCKNTPKLNCIKGGNLTKRWINCTMVTVLATRNSEDVQLFFPARTPVFVSPFIFFSNEKRVCVLWLRHQLSIEFLL